MNKTISFKTTDGDAEEITSFSKKEFDSFKHNLKLRTSIKSDRILYFVEENSKIDIYKVFKGDYFEEIL